MTKRSHGESPQSNIADHLQPLIEDDAFLTELSLGNDPSHGTDELAQMLLELRGDVEAQMPPAPQIEGADEAPAVISLDDARRNRRKSRPLLHGLIGAAAATVLIAGAGTAIYNAGPSSPLYGANQTVFGNDDPEVVELAGALDELEDRAAQGDMDGTRALLEDLRKKVGEIERNGVGKEQAARTTTTVTHTPEAKTTTVQPEPGANQPTTVVERVTETAVQTVTVTEQVPANPLPLPGEETEPTEVSADPDPGQDGEPTMAPPQVN